MFSFIQVQVNAPTASESGAQNLELTVSIGHSLGLQIYQKYEGPTEYLTKKILLGLASSHRNPPNGYNSLPAHSVLLESIQVQFVFNY